MIFHKELLVRDLDRMHVNFAYKTLNWLLQKADPSVEASFLSRDVKTHLLIT